jgi:outer membrane biosynthesis protein TonB
VQLLLRISVFHIFILIVFDLKEAFDLSSQSINILKENLTTPTSVEPTPDDLHEENMTETKISQTSLENEPQPQIVQEAKEKEIFEDITLQKNTQQEQKSEQQGQESEQQKQEKEKEEQESEQQERRKEPQEIEQATQEKNEEGK